MGVRMPGQISGLFDPKVVEQLIEVEKLPAEQAKKRKDHVVKEKEEVEKLQTLLVQLDGTLNGLKSKSDFYKMKVESSHPDIIDGTVEGVTIPGSYEFEVRGVARAEKELAYGFPDKDKTTVGFGFMLVEREDREPAEITIEPGSTLQDVTQAINDADVGVKAMVINTKYKPDPFRLLVVSENSGKEASVFIDEDTTYLEFKEQVKGRNLDVLFEDVPITDEDNSLEDLVDGVVFMVKRSEPGTRIQVGIVHDIDKTMEGIQDFVAKFNEVSEFVHAQVQVDPKTKKAGILAADSSVKTVMRQIQAELGNSQSTTGKYHSLADIGITTDPKSGNLTMSEAKVRQSLAEDYDGVANLFVHGRASEGVASRLADRLKYFRDPASGVIKSKLRGLDKVIQNQDQEIERKEMIAGKKEEGLRRRFTALEGQLAQLQSQGSFLSQKLGGGGGDKGG